MNRESRGVEPIGQSHESVMNDAVDEFTELLNAGQQPEIDHFIERYPSCSLALRPILQTLAAMRQDPIDDEPNGGVVSDGASLGDFRIIREIGRGGMGIVYEAEQMSLNRRVALKILPFVALLDSPQLKRFRTEACAAAMLKHPNIVSVYSIAHERGVNYYAMELIDGPSLAEVLSEPANPISSRRSNQSDILESSEKQMEETAAVKALSTERSTNRPSFYRRIAELGIQIAEALQYAHVEGVIHRDIKPANLLLDETGRVHVADFGLARMQTDADLTMSGDLVGTLRYMSPEQIAGDRLIDQRTDVYSLGLTLYELIAQRPAFPQTSRHELIKAIGETDPLSITKVDKRVPTDLATIVHKAIVKEPEDRYQQSCELADDLRRFLEHRTISAKRSTRFERLQRTIRRNPIVSSLLAFVFVLLVGLSTISTVFALRYAAHSKKQTIESRKQRLGLYAREMRLAQAAIDGTQQEHAEELLLHWVPDLEEEDHRGFEWYHLWARCFRSRARWTISHDSYIYDVAFSPDGRFVAESSIGPVIHIWDATQGGRAEPVRQIVLPFYSFQTLESFQDGPYLMAGSESGYVGIWNWKTYEQIDSFIVQTENDRNMILSLDMNQAKDLIAAVAYHGVIGSSVVVWDRTNRQVATSVEYPGKAWAAFGKNGNLFVASPEYAHVDTLDPRDGKTVHQRTLSGQWNASDVFPNGEFIAICLSRQHGDVSENWFELRRLDDWEETSRQFVGEAPVTEVCVAPDGLEIAVGNTLGQVLQINLNDLSCQRRTIHNDPVESLGYSPDSKHIASTERSRYAYVYPRQPTSEPKPLITRCRRKPLMVTGIGFVDDGRTVCTNENTNLIRFWDAYTGELRDEPIELAKGPWNLIRLQTDPLRGRVAIVQTNWPFDLTTGKAKMRVNATHAKATIWDHNLNRIIGEFDQLPDEVFNHVFSFDGKYVAVCGIQSLTVIDIANRTTIEVLRSEPWIYACAFSSDNQKLYCAMLDGHTRVFEVGSWHELDESFLTDSRRMQSISCSPDGRFLGACGFDCQLKLFDQGSHELLIESDRVPMYPSYIRFSHDGERAAVGSPEGIVRVYMTETAEEVLRIDVPNQYTWCEFSQDGHSLAIASIVDAMVVHGPDRRAIAPLSESQLRETMRQNSRMYRAKEPH